jgi:hypothetical protein
MALPAKLCLSLVKKSGGGLTMLKSEKIVIDK